jgi:Prefoldin subunit
MVAYPINEAETLLQNKLVAAQKSLGNCDEDLDFLREQITVTQLEHSY